MSFDERTPRDIFNRDDSARRRASRIDLADDLEVRAVTPVAPPPEAPPADSGKSKKLLLGAVVFAVLVSAGLLLAPSNKQTTGQQTTVLGAGTGAAPLPVVATAPTTTAITSASDPNFESALVAYLKELSARKGLTEQKLASALEQKFSLPVGIEKMPKPATGGGMELQKIGTAEILVQVEDASSRVVGFHATPIH